MSDAELSSRGKYRCVFRGGPCDGKEVYRSERRPFIEVAEWPAFSPLSSIPAESVEKTIRVHVYERVGEEEYAWRG